MNPKVESFFDEATSTVTHVVSSGAGSDAAIIDSVLDFDASPDAPVARVLTK